MIKLDNRQQLKLILLLQVMGFYVVQVDYPIHLDQWTCSFSLIVYDLNDMCIFLLMNLIRMTYLTIYQIEHPIKFNKTLTTLVKMANGFSQMWHPIKLD
jgi:hypothetical protein